MKGVKGRVTIIYKNNFNSKKVEDIIKNIINLNKTINIIDNYSQLSISCENVQMKTNSIRKFNKEEFNIKDPSNFLIFKN